MVPLGSARITVGYGGANCPTGAVNVFGVTLLDTAATPTSIAETVKGIWNTRVLPSLTDDILVNGVLVKFGPDDLGAFAVSSANSPGQAAGTSMPPNTAFLVTKATGLGGRRGRGRMFLPGVAEAVADDSGVISTATLQAIQPRISGVLTDLSAAGIPMVVLHSPPTVWQLVGGQPRRVPTAGAVPNPTTVTALNVSNRVATQRRRLRR